MKPPAPLPATFTVDMPDLGKFTFRRRNLGDDLRIMADYDRITGGLESPSSLLDSLATALATYKVLAAAWPSAEWAPLRVEKMDTLADDRTAQLLSLFGALSAREDEFRPAAKRRFAAPGPGPSEEPGDVVPPEIQPPAE
jgi:hypothetical protein